MNTKKIIRQLREEFPGSRIIRNKDKNGATIELICEIEPSTEHPEYSIAIAVVDIIQPHKHLHSKEDYKILKGKLQFYQNYQELNLKEGDAVHIAPGTLHWGNGQEVWLEVTSRPGWTPHDHIILA